MAGPRISLCMIVCDEADLLPDCLRSVRPFVDEIVVVDTGSVDETPRLAREAGAFVLERPWDDDFAAARNAALDRSGGEWILLLDADERLAPGAGERIREAVLRADADAFGLVLHNARSVGASVEDVLSGRARSGLPIRLARLLRNVDGLRWTRPVHESVDDWLARRRERIADLDAHIVHLGYASEVRARPRKEGRNLRILEAYCPGAPDDHVAWTFLAHERDAAGDPVGAFEAAERGWRVLHEVMKDPGSLSNIANLAVKRASLLLRRGDLGRAASTLEQAWMWAADHPNLDFMRGMVHEVQANETSNAFNRRVHLEQALRRYRRVQDLQGGVFCEEVAPPATGAGLLLRIGIVLLQLGDPSGALDALDEAAALDEDLEAGAPGAYAGVEIRLARAEALQDLGRDQEADAILESLSDLPLMDVLVLRARSASGSMRPTLLRLLVASPPRQGYLAPHRMRLLARMVHEDPEALAALKAGFYAGGA